MNLRNSNYNHFRDFLSIKIGSILNLNFWLLVIFFNLINLKSNFAQNKGNTVRQAGSQSTPLKRGQSGKDSFDLSNEAILLGKGGQYDRALNRFMDVLKIQREQIAKTYNNIGYIYELKGDQLQAISNYKKSLQFNDRLVEPSANLGRLYFIRKMWQKAVDLGESVLKIDPDHKEVKKWLPIAYEKLLEEKKAKILGRESSKPEKKKNTLKLSFK